MGIKKTKADMAAELAKGDMAKRAAQKRSTAKRSATEKTGGEKDHTGSGASIIPTHVPTAATGAMISARPKRSHAGPGRTQHPRARPYPCARPLHPPHRACPRVRLLAFASRSFARRAQSVSALRTFC